MEKLIRNIQVRPDVCIELKLYFVSEDVSEIKATVRYADGKNYAVGTTTDINHFLSRETFVWDNNSIKLVIVQKGIVDEYKVVREFNFNTRELQLKNASIKELPTESRSIIFNSVIYPLDDCKQLYFLESHSIRDNKECADGYIVSIDDKEVDVKYFGTAEVRDALVALNGQRQKYVEGFQTDGTNFAIVRQNQKHPNGIVKSAININSRENLTEKEVWTLRESFTPINIKPLQLTEWNLKKRTKAAKSYEKTMSMLFPNKKENL